VSDTSAVPPPEVEGSVITAPAPERLKQGTLNVFEIASSTMANIGPALSFFFGFAIIASSSGIASPLTILVAGVAIAIVGNTLSEFTKSIPSAGSFVTFIGKAFGPSTAIAAAILIFVNVVVGLSGVLVVLGGWPEMIIAHYAGVSVPWPLIMVVLTLVVFYLVYRGVQLSTRWAALFFSFEMAIMIIGGIVLVATHSSFVTPSLFNPAKITRGLSGLGLGFTYAVYMFIGWENSAGLAEESRNPRRAVPRAIYFSIALMGITYLFVAVATVAGFKDKTGTLAGASVPFLDALPYSWLVFCAYLAGFTSTFGVILAATNGWSRVMFGACREGLLASGLAKLQPRHRTPWLILAILVVLELGIAIVFWLVNGTPSLALYGELATYSTIPLLLVYAATNLALPVYYRRVHPDRFNVVRHLIVPVIGVLVIILPFWGLVKPGQTSPYNTFAWVALANVVIAVAYGIWWTRRTPGLNARIGSVVADQ
jgi:amino acid transporter